MTVDSWTISLEVAGTNPVAHKYALDYLLNLGQDLNEYIEGMSDTYDRTLRVTISLNK